MKKALFIALIFSSFLTLAQEYEVKSPDGNIKLAVSISKTISWSVVYNGKDVILPSSLSLKISEDRILGKNPVVKRTKTNTIDNEIRPVVSTKYSLIHDHGNELTIQFKGGFSLAFRAYNDGVAYRFITDLKGTIQVYDEEALVNFHGPAQVLFPEETGFISHYERVYTDTLLHTIQSGQFCSLPALVTTMDGIRVAISETDLFDYPNMFLFGTSKDALKSGFPKYPLEVKPGRYADRDMIIVKEAPYIAETKGQRSFPWRVFIITDDDRKLVESTLTYQLSRPVALENTGWIKPGKVAWDWWNAWNIYGVDFEAGINTETYKYYIDFASAYGIDYVILDEGWSKTTDLFDIISEIDLEEIIRYGKEKNVGIILWTLWKPLDDHLEEVFDLYASMGVVGFKVDFMQRADQPMVNYYERVAKEAAKRELLIDFHGAFKPAGLSRAYPNVLTYEGVK
ncbi:MAG: glycoside hydrolase family 97 catalytic domain-containing protein, partial [Bacteroidota bacterium]|nr:glycoside hydrolase family 97 catalytic domain-containing protein [Bacteroidota bacterium]